MALTEKMIEQARQLRDSGPRGTLRKFSDEQILKAYLEHRSIGKAAAAIGCALNTVQRRLAAILDGEE